MKPLAHCLGQVACLALVLLLLPGCTQEARVAVRLERGEQYFAAEDFGRAELEFLSVLQREPTNSVAIRQLGFIHYHRGVLSRAHTFLEQARQLDPEDLEVRLRLAAVYLTRGQLSEASDELEYILEQDPAHDKALLQLAETALTPDLILRAGQRLESLRPVSDDRPAWHLARMHLALRQGDLDAAAEAVRRTLELEPMSSAGRIANATLYWLRGDLQQAERELELGVANAPRYSVRSLKLAEFHWRTGNLDKAAQLLDAITDRTPDFVPAWSMTADVAFEQQRWDDCQAATRRILVLDPINHNALVMNAALAVQRGDRTKAIADLQRMLEVYPQSSRVHYALGLAHALNQEPTRAIDRLTQAVQLDPNDTRAQLLLADLHIRRRAPDAAIAVLQPLLARVPNQFTAQLLLASAHRLAGEPAQAIRVYRDLLADRPEDAQLHYLLGSTLREQGRPMDARESLIRARDLAPDNLLALEQLVELDLSEGLMDAALERVQAQIQRQPQAGATHFLLARVHTARHDMDATEQALLRGLELAPDFGPGYQMLVRLYVGSERMSQAIHQLETLAGRSPNNPVPWMQIAELQTQTGQHAEAARTYERVLKLDPDFYPALNNLAHLETEFLGNLDRAFDLARRAHHLQPSNPAVLDTFGWVMVKRGDVAQALPFLRDAAQRAGSNPEIQYHLGVAHYLLAQPEPARAALERALEAETDFIGKADAERRLAALRATPADLSDPAALAALEQYVADDPADLLSLFRLADTRIASGDPNNARALYQRALNRDPANPHILVRLAALELDAFDNRTRALDLARQTHAASPQDPQVTAEIGRVASRCGDYAMALAVLQDTVRRNPNLPGAQLDLAVVSHALGQETAADRALQEALRPGASFARHTEAADLAFLLRVSRSAPVSDADADRITELARQRPDDLAALIALGHLFEHQGRPADAVQPYQRAMALSPTSSTAYLRLARVYAAAPPANTTELNRFITQTRQAFPNNAELAKQLGIIQFQRAQFADAVQLLQIAANNLRTDAETHFYLGLAQARIPETERAKATLNRALALNPNAALATDARRVLDELP